MNTSRRRSSQVVAAVSDAVEKLQALSDGIDEIIYVIDPHTYQILFVNKKTTALLGKGLLGKKCYSVFQKLNRPCRNCTNRFVFGKNLGKTYASDHQNRWNKRWYRGMYKAIKWPGLGYAKYGLTIDITHQKKTEDALTEREEFFRSIVNNSHSGIFIIDDGFHIVYANDEAVRIGGYSRRELIGQNFTKFLTRENQKLLRSRYVRRRLGGRTPIAYQMRVETKDKRIRDIQLKCTAVRSKNGNVHIIAQLLDITESNRLTQEHKRFEERLSALNVHGQSLNLARSMDEVYRLTLDAAQKTLGFRFANILTIKKRELLLVAHRGYSRGLVIRLPLDGNKGITVKAANQGRSVLVPDVRLNEAYVRGSRGIRSELAVPIKVGKTVLGVLNVESNKLAAFDKEDRKLLEILASHTAIGISNLRKQEELREIFHNLEHLMKNTTRIMHIKKMHKRLRVIVQAIRKFGWRRVVISLRDENLEGIDLVTVGLTREENEMLRQRKAPGHIWHERLGPSFDEYRINEFYYLPWADPWVREHVHGVPAGTSFEIATTLTGVPSSLPIDEMVDWHPQDMLYAPLRTPEGRIVGILSMDDPADGKKPTADSLTPLELFLHQAAIVIENAQLIENLKEAREKLEQKVDERTQLLRESQDKLLRTQRLAVIGELAGMVGHDLRNPLTSIAGAAYFMKKQLSKGKMDQINEMIEIVDRNITYSNKIINDLLEYSREIKLDLSERDPKTMIKEALLFVQVPNHVRIVDLTEHQPKIKIDAERIQRAFVNIIKNAIEAMPRQGTLIIETRQFSDRVEIVFSDTGTGMSKSTLQRLWTPLFTTKAKGMGFGLAICKRIIEAHNGKICAQSIRGKGTTFKVMLPIKPNEQTAGGEEIWVKPPESSLLMTTKT